MARMTEEEAWALDDYVTNNELTFGPPSVDWRNIWELRHVGLSKATIDYLLTRANADGKNPAEIINEMVDKEIAIAV